MGKKLVIAVSENSDSNFARIVGTLDGKRLFTGHYGGEPEDNSRDRDYSWVENAIKVVAAEGEIEIEYEKLDIEDDD